MKPENNKSEDNHLNEELSPLLQKLKKNNPLIVPHNYFDSLSEDIFRKVQTAKTRSSAREIFLSVSWSRVVTVAAMIGIIAFLFYFLIPSNNYNKNEAIANYNTEYNAIEDYLLNTADIDEEAILAAMLENENDTPLLLFNDLDSISDDSIPVNKQKTPVFPADTTISPDDILQYLIEEEMELNPDS